jgi:hypothetical protein
MYQFQSAQRKPQITFAELATEVEMGTSTSEARVSLSQLTRIVRLITRLIDRCVAGTNLKVLRNMIHPLPIRENPCHPWFNSVHFPFSSFLPHFP